MGGPPRSIAQAPGDSEQDEKGRGTGADPYPAPAPAPGASSPTEAGSPEKGLEREAQERSPPYALPRESSRAQGRRATDIKNSQQRRGFGFRTTVGARTLGALPSLSPGNSPQGAGLRRQAGSEEREFPRLGQGASHPASTPGRAQDQQTPCKKATPGASGKPLLLFNPPLRCRSPQCRTGGGGGLQAIPASSQRCRASSSSSSSPRRRGHGNTLPDFTKIWGWLAVAV